MFCLKKTSRFLKLFSIIFFITVLLQPSLVLSESTNISISESTSFQISVDQYTKLTSDRIANIKEGSRPFILSQNKKAPTVVMLHGLSDSPGSMKEVSAVYYKLGYNVVTVLLRDHGLLEAYRNEARSAIKLNDWREDIDQLMAIAFKMSDSNQVALIGYSLGGALALDTADRYDGHISSIVFLAPMFKINHAWAAPAAKYLKRFIYSTKKGVAEEPHFYPDIALNQIYNANLLSKHLNKSVSKSPKENLYALPKLMFLTDADTTIENDFAMETAEKINIAPSNISLFQNRKELPIVLHRDLPMKKVNATKKQNPSIDELLIRLEGFLKTI